MKVRDVMTTPVLTTTPETSLKQAALTLARDGVSGLPVVDASGAVVGVFSEADVIAKEGEKPRQGGAMRWLFDVGDPWREDRFAARTVGDAMTAPAKTIAPDRPVAEAATRMIEEGVNRLPVVEDDRLVGIVSRADLVRAFVRSDEEIRQEIETEVVRKALWLDPSDLRVTVADGYVTLEGLVSSTADTELLPTFTRRVPGVVAVEAKLAARVED